MSTPILLDKDSSKAALNYIWGQYRTWDLTSQMYKSDVARWRDIILALSVGGAVLGTLCQQIDSWGLSAISAWVSATLGLLSGAALGLAAYFTKEVLTPEPEGRAVRARAAAEAFKREAYLLVTSAPPYATATSTDELLSKTKEIRAGVASITPVASTSEQEQAGAPPVPMSIDDYVQQRVVQQIDEYYLPQVRANFKKLATGRRLSVALGALAVLLGLWSAKSASVAGWVAVVGTITAAIAARQYAGRYQFLILSYQATAERLKWLKTKWEIDSKSKNEVAAQQAFVLACEDAIATENSAWMAEWTKKSSE